MGLPILAFSVKSKFGSCRDREEASFWSSFRCFKKSWEKLWVLTKPVLFCCVKWNNFSLPFPLVSFVVCLFYAVPHFGIWVSWSSVWALIFLSLLVSCNLFVTNLWRWGFIFFYHFLNRRSWFSLGFSFISCSHVSGKCCDGLLISYIFICKCFLSSSLLFSPVISLPLSYFESWRSKYRALVLNWF